jgi:single-stranded-DNA-specific exonuclease
LDQEKWKSVRDAMVWAEGAEKAKGKNRFELAKADELVIYTTPPSLSDLRLAMDTVKPKKIYVVGVSPQIESTDEFLTRLAGMIKYVINNKGGKTSVKELASALAQRENAVRIGLEWLAAGGHVSTVPDAEAVFLSNGNGETNEYVQKELFIAVRGILQETAAYREYFAKANVEALINA